MFRLLCIKRIYTTNAPDPFTYVFLGAIRPYTVTQGSITVQTMILCLALFLTTLTPTLRNLSILFMVTTRILYLTTPIRVNLPWVSVTVIWCVINPLKVMKKLRNLLLSWILLERTTSSLVPTFLQLHHKKTIPLLPLMLPSSKILVSTLKLLHPKSCTPNSLGDSKIWLGTFIPLYIPRNTPPSPAPKKKAGSAVVAMTYGKS